ncbi:MAG TPA: hypothetical protein VIW01_14075 [Dehalococcoidia bacterium]
MRPALTPVQAPDQPGQRSPTLLQDLGTVAHLYGTVFWMLGRRLQHGRRWEQKLAAMSLRSYGFGTDHDARRMMRHPN